MSELVINVLEIIEVDHQDGKRPSFPCDLTAQVSRLFDVGGLATGTGQRVLFIFIAQLIYLLFLVLDLVLRLCLLLQIINDVNLNGPYAIINLRYLIICLYVEIHDACGLVILVLGRIEPLHLPGHLPDGIYYDLVHEEHGSENDDDRVYDSTYGKANQEGCPLRHYLIHVDVAADYADAVSF